MWLDTIKSKCKVKSHMDTHKSKHAPCLYSRHTNTHTYIYYWQYYITNCRLCPLHHILRLDSQGSTPVQVQNSTVTEVLLSQNCWHTGQRYFRICSGRIGYHQHWHQSSNSCCLWQVGRKEKFNGIPQSLTLGVLIFSWHMVFNYIFMFLFQIQLQHTSCMW